MDNYSEANRRIAKNAMLLYIRMGVMMIISFFTARITLEALGVVDYGINNVVGGLVSMFALISNSITNSIGRFITVGLGKGDKEELNKIFSTSVNIQIILAIIVLIAIETIGIWFLNNKMVIPAERLTAANWVLQCSAFMFAIGLLSVPYNAAIIAHEKMGVYAYFTLFDAFSRLAIIFVIKYYGDDKLILLAIISIIPSLIKQLYYWHYSKKHFEECTYHAVWDKKIFKEMFGFAGWNFIGCTAGLSKDHVVNILINIFTNPAVNAARGVAMQIRGIISQFISGFSTAITPQITKEYAAGNLSRLHTLIYTGTRLSFYLFLFISIPIFLEIENILYLWLGQVPEHTVLFTRLVIIYSLSEIISEYLITAQYANGNIRNYQITVGGIMLMNVPISYIMLKNGCIPESTLFVGIIVSQLCFASRLIFLRKSIKLNIIDFLKDVYLRVIIVSIVSIVLPLTMYCLINHSVIRFITVCITSVITTGAAIYFIGCNMKEKKIIMKYIHGIISKIYGKRTETN